MRIPSVISRATSACGSFVLDIFLPQFCITCRTEGFALCSRCLSLLPDAIQRCPFCSDESLQGMCCSSHQTQALSSMVAVYAYDDIPITTIIHTWKYRPHRLLGYLLFERLNERQWREWLVRLHEHIDVIVPIPLHPRKERKRGFNQSADLAHMISEGSGVPVVNLLRRILYRSPQASFSSRDSRLRNAAGAFALTDPDLLSGARLRILLVDDVITTGATMESAATVLRPIAQSIDGWCLTRGNVDDLSVTQEEK